MKLYRPAHLRFEFRDTPELQLRRLLSGAADGGGWFAEAPHLDAPVELDLADLALLAGVPAAGLEADLSDLDLGRIERLLRAIDRFQQRYAKKAGTKEAAAK